MSERARARIVGLDLMSTLLYDPFLEAFERAEGASLVERRPLIREGAWEAFERDELSEEEYGRLFYREDAGLLFDVGAFRRELEAGYAFLEGMEELLAELAARRPVHVMSNYPLWYETVRERFALDRHVAMHHVSYELGARKPDPRYYRAVLERAGVAPGELVFVDDRPENVAAAEALGIDAILFEGADRLREELSPLLEGRA